MQLLCIGDIGIINEDILQSIWMHPSGETSDDLRVLFNCELPIGNTINPRPRSRGPRVVAHPKSLQVLKKWPPGFASLATNHILDAGGVGLCNTMQTLNKMGFTTVGAGKTWEEITKPLFWETTEGKLAIINWVFPETHPDWMAVPGPNCWPGLENARHIIQDARHEANWVLLVLHWSDEYFPYPRPEDRSIANELARMGADLVVGHHPHVVRGLEIIGSCPVFYSIGNFYFSNLHAPRNREVLALRIIFQKGKRPEYQVLSFWKTKSKVVPDKIRRASRRMKKVSHPLKLLRRSKYNEWYALKRNHFNKYGARWHFGVRRLGILGTIRHLQKLFYSYLHSSYNV